MIVSIYPSCDRDDMQQGEDNTVLHMTDIVGKHTFMYLQLNSAQFQTVDSCE